MKFQSKLLPHYGRTCFFKRNNTIYPTIFEDGVFKVVEKCDYYGELKAYGRNKVESMTSYDLCYTGQEFKPSIGCWHWSNTEVEFIFELERLEKTNALTKVANSRRITFLDILNAFCSFDPLFNGFKGVKEVNEFKLT